MDAMENILFLPMFFTPCFIEYPNVLILIIIPTFFLVADDNILVGLITKTQDEAKTKEYLDELEFLADTAGYNANYSWERGTEDE